MATGNRCCEHCMDPKKVEDNFKRIQKFADKLDEALEDHLTQIYVRLDELDGKGGPE